MAEALGIRWWASFKLRSPFLLIGPSRSYLLLLEKEVVCVFSLLFVLFHWIGLYVKLRAQQIAIPSKFLELNSEYTCFPHHHGIFNEATVLEQVPQNLTRVFNYPLMLSKCPQFCRKGIHIICHILDSHIRMSLVIWQLSPQTCNETNLNQESSIRRDHSR